MRRTDKERTEPGFMERVLRETDIISVAFAPEQPGEAPYVLLVNHVLHEGSIYFHCAQTGRKLECLKNNPMVGFTAAAGVEIMRAEATTRYRSVCGTARASFVEDAGLKREALEALARRFRTECMTPTPEKAMATVTLVRLDIQEMTGKQSPAEERD